MDDVSTSYDAAERSFLHEEEGENEQNSIADDFGTYDCFMQPFGFPDEGDEQTKELEMELFDQIDKNNSDHQVALFSSLSFSLINLYRNRCLYCYQLHYARNNFRVLSTGAQRYLKRLHVSPDGGTQATKFCKGPTLTLF